MLADRRRDGRDAGPVRGRANTIWRASSWARWSGSKILDPRRVRPGDVLLALPSSGLHTNGYSLARKLVFDVAKLEPDTYVAEVGNKIGAELLKPHRAYWPLLKKILARGWVSSMAHITGGGITGNLPRALPRNVQAVVELGSWPVLPIFSYLARLGKIERDELLQDVQSGRGNDSGGAGEVIVARGSGTEAAAREILPDRANRERRAREAARGLLRRTSVSQTLRLPSLWSRSPNYANFARA